MRQGLYCRNVGFTRHANDGTEHTVLKAINATFRAGHVALISGVTGAGKSTLLHILAGLMRPTEGQVMADGQPVSRWITAHRDRWRRSVGIVFQGHRLLQGLTVLENVILPMIPRGLRLAELRAQGGDALDRLAVSHLAGQTVAALSGGERQRVAIARAMIAQPAFLMVDEPTAHQDNDSLKTILQAFTAAKNWNATIVVASHDRRIQQAEFADAWYHLEDGRLQEMK